MTDQNQQPHAPVPPGSAQPFSSGVEQQAAGAYGQQQAYAYQQAYAQQQAYALSCAASQASRKSKAGWIVGGVFLFVVVFMFMIGALSCSRMFSDVSAAGADAAAVTAGDAVGVIDIAGTIQYDGTACSPEGLSDLLDQAEANPDIKAVVLRVDSGGGVATAGEEMAAYVRDFSKPVVVSSASMNCSAAYEISSQADYIFVNETTAIGAIGTIMQTTDLSGLMDMLGISVENIASAESKDSSYGTRPLTDEERAYYQELVNTINETFIRNVSEGRRMSVEDVRALATGMQFAGTTAVENGLADEVGIYDAAVEKAAELGGIEYDIEEGAPYDVVKLNAAPDEFGALMDLLGSSSSLQAAEELIGLLKQEDVLS